MTLPEKTVFICYRRKDISWALAVYHYLTKHNFDVFFDYKSIPSGDFEKIIMGNIKARAHFLVILTPTALDRTNEPGDWLRREIENAISVRRNIIPLFFDGFNFGAPSVSEKLIGKLSRLKRYNGLEVPAGYFDEAMDRLRDRYLNVTLDAVLHPVSEEVQKVVKEQQVAANQAILSKEYLEEKTRQKKEIQEKKEAEERVRIASVQKTGKEKEGFERKSEKTRENSVFSYSQSHRKQERVDSTTNRSLLLFSIGAIMSFVIAWLVFNNSGPEQPIQSSLGVRTLRTLTSPDDGMTLVYIPAGKFIMGSDSSHEDEAPAHTVNLDAFWIDQTEVTNFMFTEFLNSQDYQAEGDIKWFLSNQYDIRIHLVENKWQADTGYEYHPMESVTWDGAMAYCSWVSRRLPTEAEWEKAARGEDGRTYPWGEEIDCQKTNYNRSCVGASTVIGSYPSGASPYGALDMSGNSEEWVEDWYDAYPGNTASNIRYGTSYRVTRGGGWAGSAYDVKTTSRNDGDPLIQRHVGFRCAMDATE